MKRVVSSSILCAVVFLFAVISLMAVQKWKKSKEKQTVQEAFMK
jgi:hypothetical protein